MIIKISKYFVFAVLLNGCGQLETAILAKPRPKEILGEKCMDSPRLKVLQVLNNGVLAHLCPVDYPSYYDDAFEACAVKGDLVFMSVPSKSNDYVDEQKVTLTPKQCFVADGTFSYTSSDNRKRTVRHIKILEESPTTQEASK